MDPRLALFNPYLQESYGYGDNPRLHLFMINENEKSPWHNNYKGDSVYGTTRTTANIIKKQNTKLPNKTLVPSSNWLDDVSTNAWSRGPLGDDPRSPNFNPRY